MKSIIKKSLVAFAAMVLVLSFTAGKTASVNAEEAEQCATCAEYDEKGFCKVCDAYQAPLTITKQYDVDNDGEPEDVMVYEIANAGQLYWFANYVNSVNDTASAVLTANIVVNTNVLDENGDLNTGEFRVWTPINGFGGGTQRTIFDGQGYTISGLYYDNVEESSTYIGLFGKEAYLATIQNVGLVDSYLRGYRHVGGIIGKTDKYVSIINCHNKSTIVSDYSDVGGIVGRTEGIDCEVTGCYNEGKVQGQDYAGGIVGYAKYVTISKCYNVGTVTGRDNVGGIAGYCSGDTTISYCYNNVGTVTGRDKVGGIAGYCSDSTTISYCYNMGSVSGSTYIGSVVGRLDTTNVTLCRYLRGTASYGAGDVTKDPTGIAVTTDNEVSNGNLAFTLNYSNSNEGVIWRQNLGGENADAYPVLDSTHGIVYKKSEYECPDDSNPTTVYRNVDENIVPEVHPWEDGYCSICSTTCSHPTWTDGACSVCGKDCPHDGATDDGDCLTAVTCPDCSFEIKPARTEHTAKEDDGDCTTPITCQYCDYVMTAAYGAHVANEDDGNCTTPIICSRENCTAVTTLGETHVDADKNGYCDNEGCTVLIYALYGRTLILGGDIGVVFYFELDESVRNRNTYVEFTYNGKTTSVNFSECLEKEENGKTYYGFMCKVHATEMNQTITAKLYTGEELLGEYTYSVEQYCANKLPELDANNDQDAKTIAIIEALQVYGATARKYFDPEAEGATVEEEFKFTENEKKDLKDHYLKSTETSGTIGIQCSGLSLVLFSETSIRVYYTFPEEETMESYTFTVKAGENAWENWETGSNAKGSYLEIKGIGATNLDTSFTIVAKKDDNNYYTVTYSAFAYIANKLEAQNENLINLITALYRYNKAAEAYR